MVLMSEIRLALPQIKFINTHCDQLENPHLAPAELEIRLAVNTVLRYQCTFLKTRMGICY